MYKPKVLYPLKKEIHYSDEFYNIKWTLYQIHFPFEKGNFITGEASKIYLFSPHAPKRIEDRLHNAKFIVLLRNPIERAHSHYHHELKNGN